MNKELPALLEAFKDIKVTDKTSIEYRLYHDEQGHPLFMSSSGTESGNYIVIDKETYDRANYQHLRVVEGKLVIVDEINYHCQRLHRSPTGIRVVKGHASLALMKEETYLQEECYGFKNH